VAPGLVLLVAVLVSGYCWHRMLVNIKRYRKWRRISERIILSLVILVVVSVGGSATFNALAIHHYRVMNPSPGNLYVVHGHRMHIYCTGQGSPSLVLDAGLGNDSLIWGKVQLELSKTTRVCSYDRAGFGWSDPQSGPRDADRIADELHSLLTQAGVTGPTVLMGHSIAGIYIRAYATRYPQDLAGLIFVDGSTPLQEERAEFKAIASKAPSPALGLLLMKSVFTLGIPRIMGVCSHPMPGFEVHAGKMLAEDRCRLSASAIRLEYESIRQSGDETIHSGPFGNLPILIFSHDPDTPLPGRIPQKLKNDFASVWNQMQEDLKNLSARSQRIIAKGSGHYVQIDRADILNKEVTIFIQQIRGTGPQLADYGSTKTE
jgi:pimeloyl-ACP methyl ester carboxylesterase